MPIRPVRILVKRLPGCDDIPIPTYHTAGASGLDLHNAGGSIELRPGDTANIACGFALAIPDGCEAQIRPRSGLALEHGVTVLNAPGTIDADFRGEVRVLLVNLGRRSVSLERGQRIAQIVFQQVTRVELSEVEELPSSSRGVRGFGHTGSRGPIT